MSASALRFSAAWPEAAALAAQIVDRHVEAFGRAPHAWSVTDHADEATSTATVLLTTDTAQAERARSAGAAVVLTAVEGDQRIDTVYDRLGTYRFTSAAQGDAFDVRFVAIAKPGVVVDQIAPTPFHVLPIGLAKAAFKSHSRSFGQVRCGPRRDLAAGIKGDEVRGVAVIGHCFVEVFQPFH